MSDTDALTLATRAVQMKMLGRTINQIKPEDLARAALDAVGALAEGTQPNPVPNDLPSCHDLAIEQLEASEYDTAERDALIASLRERKAFGLRKYASLLQPFNKRSALDDALAEVLDLIVYTVQNEYEEWENTRGDSPRPILALKAMSDALDLGILLVRMRSSLA